MAIMMDLETLGLHPGCVVLSIAAIRFDPCGGMPEIVTVDGQPQVPGAFYQVVDKESCLRHGLVTDPEVETWWETQDADVRAAVFEVEGAPLAETAERFSEWFGDPREPVWAHGASFDQPIWDAACRAAGTTPPWHFRSVRDSRTLVDLAYPKGSPPQRIGAYPRHHALFDCYRQIGMVQSCFRKLGLTSS